MDIDGLFINYIQVGEGPDVVLLHGWGQNIDMMKPIADKMDGYKFTILDFPGFGKSDEPSTAWDVEKYTVLLEKLLKELKIKNPIIVGHSFGGRVAINYSSRNKVSKVVLFGSPCIRYDSDVNHKKEEFYHRIKRLPGMNKIAEFAKKFIGSEDYRKASPIMRETLVNVINSDLSKEASMIDAPVLLIWGTNDEQEPVERARDMEKLLKDGALIELEGLSHYAYLEALPRVVNILNNFFGG